MLNTRITAPAGARGRSILDAVAGMSLGELANHLYDAGMGEETIGRLLRTIGALRIRASWYAPRVNSRNKARKASETEVTAQLVLPLLQALGWSLQLTALEWNRVDVALFRALPRNDDNLETIIEVKRLGVDCFKAKSQALRYAKARANCRRMVLTDGLRYAVYLRRDRFRLHAYLDLAYPQDSYPEFDCRGAKDALLAIAARSPT